MPSIRRKLCHVFFGVLIVISVVLNTRLVFFAKESTQRPVVSSDWKKSPRSNGHRIVSTASQNENYSLEWQDGCQVWRANDTQNLQTPKDANLQRPPPTGIAVTLAKRKKEKSGDLLELLCQKIPTQQAYFYEPQGIDLLILLEMEGASYTQVAKCLELQSRQEAAVQYTNLDGSVLNVYKYTSKTGRGRVFLAPFAMQYPEYIQRNRSRLQETMEGCDRGTESEDYVQGTRYYSNDVLNLQILQNYDYFLKIDLDVEFRDEIVPFHVLHDMRLRGAVFGHTGEFLPKGFGGCTKNINLAVDSFVQMALMETKTKRSDESANKPEWTKAASWTGPCSVGVDAFERGKDQYYTNFIFMSVAFFTSQHVRDYGKWMNEFYPGFFRYGWTDQLFFHKVMGLFLGPE
eukprot:scaffold25998_cov122-Cylindrotheca_fusiformis.AAC.7